MTWSLRSRRAPRMSRHTIRYARPRLEQLESRNVMSVMYPGLTTYSSVFGPTIEAYSPLDNVPRTYGDGFQTLTGAYGPQTYAPNITGLFAIDNGSGGVLAVGASNTNAAVELGNAGMSMLNTQISFAGTVTPLASPTLPMTNYGGTILEMPTGENGAFASASGLGSASTSLETPFTPYVSLVDLSGNLGANLIALSAQSAPAPFAPGLAVDPSQLRLGLISPLYQGYINYLQMVPLATRGAGMGAGLGVEGAAAAIEQLTPEELQDLQREMQNHLNLINYNDTQDLLDEGPASPIRAVSADTLLELRLRWLDELLPPATLTDLQHEHQLQQAS